MDHNVPDTGVDLAGVHFLGRHGSPDTLWVHSRCYHTVPCHQWALLPLTWWSLCFRPAVQSIVLSPSYVLYVVVCWRTVPWPPSGATLTHPHLTEMTSNFSRVNIKYNKGEMLHWKKNFVYSPIFTKFGIRVGIWTLTTGKILMSGYHDNGC